MVAVGEVLLHVKITLLQLWLGGLLWPLTGNAQNHNPPEVVIPLRMSGSSRGMRSTGWLFYSFYFSGHTHIMYMKAKKLLVSRHFSVFTYNDQGALHEDQPFIQRDCYYHGYVEGDPDSMVALTTCLGGFRGTLQINNTAYEIKPKSLSSTFEHLVYKMDSEETQLLPTRCGLTDEERARQLQLQGRDNSTLMQSGYEGWWTHRRFLKVALVVDHERFLYQQSNASRVVEEVLIVFNEISSILFSLDLDVILLGLEIWTERNPITVSTIQILLDDFCNWKRVTLNNRIKNDVAHLLVEKDFGMYLGLAYIGSVCDPGLNCAVNSFIGENLNRFGHIVAHEIGHNLGMEHDGDLCVCGQPLCMMHPATNTFKKFSNCSYAFLVDNYVNKNCMHKAPKQLDFFSWKVCGNGVVEDGEECDCGSFTSCGQDPCCREGCTLKYGADCAFGLCCKDCLFMSPGTVCREKDNECDLPEWCNGTSGECPEDSYVQDGSPCKGGGYCYEKRCNQRDEQCRQIFGKEARSADESCYMEMNTRGDRFGNCGATDEAYIRCNTSDTLCGRVHCDNVKEIPLLQGHSTVHWNQLNSVTCWSTDYHWGMTIPDAGDVKDGTGCGEERVCMRRKCVQKSIWRSDCSPQTCNMKGVCNNKHHCHCDSGWGPPHCLVNGFGGSVDSGSPIGEQRSRKISRKNYIGLTLLSLIPFWIALSSLLIWLFKRDKSSHNKKESSVHTSPKEQYSNIQSSPE